ncbi:hypothetical protein Sa4125_44280 [Aureimonas sp. SA4125]|uniref:DUF2628 domain-containing protein n=1 Tax=Aureimonas sp. SA4125 TaxID=2826993 RepID=UPI001CC75EAB|nr:DUF2628 domain-containing protein [Aureimonas sp. SA4125]BDA86886.1 hypothetical protein Sa4125_44280 [Aureimonas sp. SA4125]
MTRYVVFEPPTDDGLRPSEGAVFLRDGLTRWAVLFPHLWLWRHKMVLPGLLALALVLFLGWAAERAGLGLAGTVLPLLVGLYVALEGPSLRAARYRRRGFEEVAVVDAEDEAEATILYYAGEAGHAEVRPAAASPSPGDGRTPSRRLAERRASLGLFDPQGMR